MPTFKIKNLMIDVVSGARVPDLDKLCLFPSKPGCWFVNSCLKFISPPCFGFWSTCILRSIPPCNFIHSTVFECTPPSVECGDSDLPMVCGGTELVVIDLRKLVVNPAVIKEVQVELEEVLKVAGERGIELNKTMAPQTKAQVDLLENELKAAMEEVQKLKGTLK